MNYTCGPILEDMLPFFSFLRILKLVEIDFHVHCNIYFFHIEQVTNQISWFCTTLWLEVDVLIIIISAWINQMQSNKHIYHLRWFFSFLICYLDTVLLWHMQGTQQVSGNKLQLEQVNCTCGYWRFIAYIHVDWNIFKSRF